MIILDKKEIVKQRFENKLSEDAYEFEGNMKGAFKNKDADGMVTKKTSVSMNSTQWEGSEGHAQIWSRIEDISKKYRKKASNAAMLPDDLYTLTDLMRLDLTRRRMQEDDYTSFVMNEQSNPAFTKTVTLDEFLEYGAIFKAITGNNDAVNLLEQKSGATGSVTMDMFAVGDKTSIQNLLYNTIYDIEKVMRAVTRGYVGLRNNRNVLGLMVAKTTATGWDSAQQQAADTTSGATKEELLYNTLMSAYSKLLGLIDPQTQQTISVPEVYLAIPYSKQIWFPRAINGQLNVGGKGKPSNFEALTWITALIPYRGDTIYAGNESVSYAGVATTKAYMFVPRVAYTLVKRPLTMEMGTGSVLNLSTEERAWYGIQSEYTTEFFGGSGGGTSGEGFCIEVTLPTL